MNKDKGLGAAFGNRLSSSTEPASGLAPTGFDPARGDLFGDAAPSLLPVITLWQPWASLIFAGVKKHETRGFRYPVKLEGQVIAIHSAAKFPALKHISGELNNLCYDLWGCGYNFTLPLGCLLGTVRLSGCSPTDLSAGFQDQDNLIAGDWSSGRYAWALDDVTPFPAPIPAKGKRGWWSFPCDRDGARSAETACPDPVPQDRQARAEGIAQNPEQQHD